MKASRAQMRLLKRLDDIEASNQEIIEMLSKQPKTRKPRTKAKAKAAFSATDTGLNLVIPANEEAQNA